MCYSVVAIEQQPALPSPGVSPSFAHRALDVSLEQMAEADACDAAKSLFLAVKCC